MMRAVILSDCLNEDCDEMALLKCIYDGISVSHAIEWINIRDLDIESCKECFRCDPHGECVLPEDDAQRVGRFVFASDILIIALEDCPENPSIKFKSLIKRIEGFLVFRSRQGKTCAWREDRFMILISPTVKSDGRCRAQLDALGSDFITMKFSKGGFNLVKTLHPLEDSSEGLRSLAFENARNLGRSLAKIWVAC
jgi:multimeric flavodoxin WrbA